MILATIRNITLLGLRQLNSVIREKPEVARNKTTSRIQKWPLDRLDSTLYPTGLVSSDSDDSVDE